MAVCNHLITERRICKILFGVLAVLVIPVRAQEKAPAGVAPAAPQPISLTQVAERSEELTRTLREISRRLPEDSDLAAFENNLREQDNLVRGRLADSETAIAMGGTLLDIRGLLRDWRTYSAAESEQRKTLSKWGKTCEQNLTLLNNEQQVWETTLRTITRLPELSSLVVRVRSTITDIQAVHGAAEQRLRTVLDLQARVSKQALIVADIVEKLEAVRQGFQARMFYPDAPPIWQALPKDGTEPISTVLSRSIAKFYSDSVSFAKVHRGGLFRGVLFIVFAVVISRRLRHVFLNIGSQDETVARAALVLKRPVSLAAIIAAPLITLSSPNARTNVVLLLISIFLLPITRLLPLYTPAVRLVYFMAGFYGLNICVGTLDADPVVRRWLIALIFATAACILAWWGRPERLRRADLREGSLHEDGIPFVRWSLALVIPILVANVLGFLLLSYLLRLTLLLCSCFGLLLYTSVRTMTTLFAAMLRLPRLRSLASVRLHEHALVRWAERVMKGSAVFCWLYVTLTLLELQEPARETLVAILNARLGIRAFNFSLGDILAFLSVLVFGYLIASGCRFILREEILRHWRLARGVPETIATSLHYTLLLLVFLMSLSAGGIELGKLTLLTGALGVGLGFGLQNIVNNFVSGLILQFERPIRVGDVLEVGTLSGEVRRIGIRASTMRTFQGAEVIIPNSTFISGQVVNWTLSEPVRRVEVPVPVAYGTDPERVIKMLLEIAVSHSGCCGDQSPLRCLRVSEKAPSTFC